MVIKPIIIVLAVFWLNNNLKVFPVNFGDIGSDFAHNQYHFFLGDFCSVWPVILLKQQETVECISNKLRKNISYTNRDFYVLSLKKTQATFVAWVTYYL